MAMPTIVDAVREDLAPIGPEHPFGMADAMVLSQLVYLNLPSFVPRLEPGGAAEGLRGAVPLSSLLRREDYPKMVGTINHADLVTELIRVTGESPRLRDIRVTNVVEPSDPHSSDRFAAMTFLLPRASQSGPDDLVIAYRGTDSTLAGWYEDFRLLFIAPPLPSQKRAAQYLATVAGERGSAKGAHVILTGHSWGGNLAEYAGASATPSLQERLQSVWSQDAPGFTEDFIESRGFQAIAGRLHRIVPADSLVGMLFDSGVEESVVESDAHGVGQHFMTTWQFERDSKDAAGTHTDTRPGTRSDARTGTQDSDGTATAAAPLRLKTIPSVSRSSQMFGTVIDKWRRAVDARTRRQLIDDLFFLLRSTGHDNFGDMAADWAGSLKKINEARKKMPAQEQAMLREVLLALWNVLRSGPAPIQKPQAHKFQAQKPQPTKPRPHEGSQPESGGAAAEPTAD